MQDFLFTFARSSGAYPHVTEGTAAEAMRNGAFDYLAKPFTPKQISEKVRKAVDKISMFLKPS